MHLLWSEKDYMVKAYTVCIYSVQGKQYGQSYMVWIYSDQGKQYDQSLHISHLL